MANSAGGNRGRAAPQPRAGRDDVQKAGAGRGRPVDRRAGSRSDGPRRSREEPGTTARVRSGEPASPRMPEPPLPDNVDIMRLERGVRAELRTLSKINAEVVAAHLVVAGELVDSDPRRALEHARAARGRASRVGAVREAVGVAAYHAEEWAEALTELRTARRISGDPRTLPLLADCERALGRPNQALRMLTDPGVDKLDPETRIELLIVVAGARRDLGQLDAALAVLARGGLDVNRARPGSARLWYAYADALQAAGRLPEAANWFAASAALDADGEMDAAERAAALL